MTDWTRKPEQPLEPEQPQKIEDKYEVFMLELGKGINGLVKEFIGPSGGFFIAMFDLNTTDGRFNYLSNANRENVVKLLEEMIVKFKGG